MAMHTQAENSDQSDQFNFEGFTAFLRTPWGGKRKKTIAQSITSDLMMFFNMTKQSCSIDSLFNITNLESFLCHIKTSKKYKATTMTEKLRRLKLAIQYIMQLNNGKDHTYSSRGSSLLKLLTEWCHSLSKDVTKQRNETTKYVDTQLNEDPTAATMVRKYKYIPHIYI